MSEAFDPVLTELIQNELASITEEMAIVIWRTGQSALMKAGDFATAVCDAQGRVIGQGFAAPMQLAVFDELLKGVCAQFDGDFTEGEIVISNDPYLGMSHMPDIAVIAPVLLDGKLGGFCVAYSHHSDVGGRFPGSSSSLCSSSYEEGLRLPNLKLVPGSAATNEMFRLIRANVRVSDEWQSDMDAKIAGCRKGAEQAAQMIRKYGWHHYEAACDHLIEHAYRSMRAAIAAAPDGVFSAELVIPDDDKRPCFDLVLRLALKISGDRISADFSGTSPQVDTALNCPVSMTKASVASALKTIIGPDLPMNRGFSDAIDLYAPESSLVHPTFPAAVGGRAVVFYAIYDVVNRALAQAMPAQVPVMGEGADLLHFSGRDASGREFAFIDLFYGGWGARPTLDGIDGVAPVFLGSYGCASAEALEADYPVVIESFGYVPDSAGPGKYRGSVAIARQWRFLVEGETMIRSVRIGAPPGLAKGQAGHAPQTRLMQQGESQVLEARTHIHLKVRPGDRIYHASAGAGGHGDPMAREPERVQADVRDGILSVAVARAQYGVQLAADGSIDWPLTRAARAGAA